MKSAVSVRIAVISGFLLICHFCTFVSCQSNCEECASSDSECICPPKVQRENLLPFSNANKRAKGSTACDHHGTRCSSIGEPHIKTFHGRNYVLLGAGIGVFTLVRYDNRSLWIQAQHIPCSAGSCNCGVMAREGNSVIGITKCNREKPLLVEYQLDRWSHSGSIQNRSGGWKITLVSGIEIQVDMWEGQRFMQLYIKGLKSEVAKNLYTGLCSVDKQEQQNCNNGNCEKYRVKTSDNLFGITKRTVMKCNHYWTSPGCNCEGARYCAEPWNAYLLKIDMTKACRRYQRQINEKDNENDVSSNEEDAISIDDLNEGQPALEAVDRGLNMGYRFFHDMRSLDNPSPVQNAEDGRRRCSDALRLTPAYEICSSRVNTSDIIENCAFDENMMKEDGPAQSVPTELETVCLDDIRLAIEASTSAASSQELKDLLAKVEKLVCPSQCSQNGKCIDSKCQCNEGFMGTDCSLKIGQVPVVERVIMPVCDIRKHPCTQIHLEATKLTNPEDVVCKMRSVDDLGGAVPAIQTSTPVISGGLVLCNLPLMPVSTKASTNGISTTVFLVQVSISNNGQTYSPELPFTVLDSNCMQCPASQTTPCQLKENTCSIGGRCYKAEESCPKDAARICNPAKCSRKWTGESSTNCDDGFENCT